jgi:hypothetical protein
MDTCSNCHEAPENCRCTDKARTVDALPDRTRALLTAGYCMGLSMSDRFAFDATDRQMLRNASDCLRALLAKL